MAMIGNGFGYGQVGGAPGYPQTPGVQTPAAPPPPPPLPGESVSFSAQTSAPPPSASPGITTRSGVHVLYTNHQYQAGLQASLPAGGLLPAPVMIHMLQTPQGAVAQASVKVNGEQKNLPAQMMPDGRVAVQMENNPNAPLLMFNPSNLDYGLSSQMKPDGDARKRSLEETIHSDGSRTLLQDARFNADGSTSYNRVEQSADGRMQASHIAQDKHGRLVDNSPLQVSTTPEGHVHIEGSVGGQARSLKEHITSGNFSWTRGPLLNWLQEKKQAGGSQPTQLSQTFGTFSGAMKSMPQRIFPTLAPAPQAAPAAPEMPLTPPQPPIYPGRVASQTPAAPPPLPPQVPPANLEATVPQPLPPQVPLANRKADAPPPLPPQNLKAAAPPPLPPELLETSSAAAAAPVSTPALKTSVVSGDITKIPADAVITGINSGQMWFGGIDGAIQRSAGNQYHAQAAAGDLSDGNTIVARGQQPHQGAFKDVVFVVDDGGIPLSDIVYKSLVSADQAGMKSVNIPAMHTGVLAGKAGPGAAVQSMAEGIRRFRESGAQNLQDVRVVVYNDPKLAGQYETALQQR